MLSILRFLATRSRKSLPRFLVLLVIFSVNYSLGATDDEGTGPNLFKGDFESGKEGYNPWGGVDGSGTFQVWPGTQLAIDDAGKVDKKSFSPSVAVGDLNGDGLPDLVIADPRGFFWYYPNSGKPKAPVFTHGEVIPVWVGGETVMGKYLKEDIVPRIQLIDYDGDGKLDLVIGNYLGQLFFVHNTGSPTEPHFSTVPNRTGITIDTHTQNLLWCNYLVPFLYDWSGKGRLDLIMGDGTYSANSIYLFTNQGGNIRPVFIEKYRQKIIPGMGREHLTPQVVDWNNDGKPDIITGERQGYIDLYLNQATGKGTPPVFDQNNPQHIQFGSVDKIGLFTTVCAADLNNDHLFDLIVASADGRIAYSYNIGTPGDPKFGPLFPLKGTYTFPKIYLPAVWRIDKYRPYGVPYGLLECTNAKLEPGFTPPPNTKLTGAAKYSVVETHPTYFKDVYVPDSNGTQDDTSAIAYTGTFSVQTNTRYTLSLWVRSVGAISTMTWSSAGPVVFEGGQRDWIKAEPTTFAVGPEWTRIHTTYMISNTSGRTGGTVDAGFDLSWSGRGTLYLDDITLKKAN